MSEQNNNAWPFSGAEGENRLDISSIFGSEPASGDVNPFDLPAAQGLLSITEQSATSAGPVLEEPVTDEMKAKNVLDIGGMLDSKTTASGEDSADVSAQQDHTLQPGQPAETPNPIAEAFEKQTEKNTRQGLLEKPPVFSYGSAREPITDPGMTFEELRIAKAEEDFPELVEGKKVSWTVEYGKVTKQIMDPKGTTIRSVKEQIERSKQFLDSLKKAKDKSPDCLVKPRVTAQSKGIASYKGVFHSLEEARESDKTICLIPGRDGRVYEYRKTELGEFLAPKDKVIDFQQLRAGFTPALPLIPMCLLNQIISFFRCYMGGLEEFEVLAHILWDNEAKEFVVHIPVQEVSKTRINADLSFDRLPEERFLHYADIHSHNSMAAKFSLTDDGDERATRLYIVLGRLDRFFPEISVRMSCGGTFLDLDPASVLEGMGGGFPSNWRNNVRLSRNPCMKLPEKFDGSFGGSVL